MVNGKRLRAIAASTVQKAGILHAKTGLAAWYGGCLSIGGRFGFAGGVLGCGFCRCLGFGRFNRRGRGLVCGFRSGCVGLGAGMPGDWFGGGFGILASILGVGLRFSGGNRLLAGNPA